MRRFSLKRQKLNRQVEKFRAAFRAELKVCEWCQKKKPVLHEIARGTADRKKAMDKRYAILGLCDPGCHQGVGLWPRAKQLALLALRRPHDFDLEAYWQLIRRRTPDQEEVDRYLQELCHEP